MAKEDKRLEKETFHRQQFVNFKVVVYRLDLGVESSSVIPRGRSFNDILRADFSDDLYQEAIEQFNDTLILRKKQKGTPPGGAASLEKSDFLTFLGDLYKKIREKVTRRNGTTLKSPTELRNDGFFQEIDITPLVRTINMTHSLEGVNSCGIQTIDPRQTKFGIEEIIRHSTHDMVADSFGEKTLQARKEELLSFRFSEFDLIRVMVYSRIGTKPSDRLNEIRSTLKAEGIGFQIPVDEAAKRFIATPAFTGVVASITNSSSVNSAASVDVSCLGMQRIFTQSVSVFNKSIADVVERSFPEFDSLDDRFTAFASIFNKHSADEIILQLFKDYFSPLELKGRSAGDDVVLGIPNLNGLLNRMQPPEKTATRGQKTKNTGKTGVSIVPMLPTIMPYHLLKLRHREPILSFDDRLQGFDGSIIDDKSAPMNMGADIKRGELNSTLKPYILMLRDSFALYNTTYTQPIEVINTIREHTFLEFFEDRTGQFHFRFPRYNHTTIIHDLGPEDVLSVSIKRDDSAVFTTNVAQRIASMIGLLIVPGAVFIDKLSIFKFGFRRPQINENPNAKSITFARALARFYRDYTAARDSRTAQIRKLGDTSINVGQMVMFRLGRANTESSVFSQTSGDGEDLQVGYVVGISEEVSVSGQYLQTLDLAFVRPASRGARGGDYKLDGTLWDIFSLDPKGIQAGTTADPSTGDIGKAFESPVDSTLKAEQWLFNLVMSKKQVSSAKFTPFASPVKLAQISASLEVIRELKEANARLRKEGLSGVESDRIKASINSLKTSIDVRLRHLALYQRASVVLDDFLGTMNKIEQDLGGDTRRQLLRKDLYKAGLELRRAMRAAGSQFGDKEGINILRLASKGTGSSVSKLSIEIIEFDSIRPVDLTLEEYINQVARRVGKSDAGNNFEFRWNEIFTARQDPARGAPSFGGTESLRPSKGGALANAFKAITQGDPNKFLGSRLRVSIGERTEMFKLFDILRIETLEIIRTLKTIVSSDQNVVAREREIVSLEKELVKALKAEAAEAAKNKKKAGEAKSSDLTSGDLAPGKMGSSITLQSDSQKVSPK